MPTRSAVRQPGARRAGACQYPLKPIAKARAKCRYIARPTRKAPVAQLDRAPDYESGGQEFESLRARQSKQRLKIDFCSSLGCDVKPGYTMGYTTRTDASPRLGRSMRPSPLVRDEGFASSKPATPISFLDSPLHGPRQIFGPSNSRSMCDQVAKFERVQSERLAVHTSFERSCYPEYERRSHNIVLCKCA